MEHDRSADMAQEGIRAAVRLVVLIEAPWHIDCETGRSPNFVDQTTKSAAR
jgi:hypothetical protein